MKMVYGKGKMTYIVWLENKGDSDHVRKQQWLKTAKSRKLNVIR